MSQPTLRAVPARAGTEIGRVALTLLGGAGLIGGAFLNWTRGTTGAHLIYESLIKTNFSTTADIVKSAGGLAVILGLAAVVGLADRTGRLTRLAGVLGIALFALFLIEVLRSADHSLQIGTWLVLAGSVLSLLGGLLVPRRTVLAPVVAQDPQPVGRRRGSRRPDEADYAESDRTAPIPADPTWDRRERGGEQTTAGGTTAPGWPAPPGNQMDPGERQALGDTSDPRDTQPVAHGHRHHLWRH